MASLKSILQGEWLGHPLHPALVHLPTALLPAALVFDVLSMLEVGGNPMVQASFYAIALGLVGALAAIPAGIADWSGIKPDKPAYKLGLIHAGLNVVVLALFALSLGWRLPVYRHAETVAMGPFLLNLVGTCVLFVSGYIGGYMVYNHGTSVARLSKQKWRRRAEEGKAILPEE